MEEARSFAMRHTSGDQLIGFSESAEIVTRGCFMVFRNQPNCDEQQF